MLLDYLPHDQPSLVQAGWDVGVPAVGAGTSAATGQPWEVTWFFIVGFGVLLLLRIVGAGLDVLRKRRGKP